MGRSMKVLFGQKLKYGRMKGFYVISEKYVSDVIALGGRPNL